MKRVLGIIILSFIVLSSCSAMIPDEKPSDISKGITSIVLSSELQEDDPNPPDSDIYTLRYNGEIYSTCFTSGMFCVADNTVIDIHNQPLYSHTGESYTSVGILDLFPEYLSAEPAGVMKPTDKETPENDFETTQSLSQFSGLGCDFHNTLLYVVDKETVITVTPCDNLSGKTAETDENVPFYSYIMYRLEGSEPTEQPEEDEETTTSLSGCFSENTDSTAVTSADFSTTGVETVEEALSEDEEATTGIPACLIMLDGVIYHIASITPTDYVVFADGEYISVCHGGASEFTELLSAENYIADIIRTESTPQVDFESDFYLDAKVYSNGESAVLLAEYPDYAQYVQVHESVDKNSFAMDDILYVFPVNP